MNEGGKENGSVVRKINYPHCDDRFLISASTPQDQGKESEEHKEANNKSQEITAARETFAIAIVVK